MTEQHTKILQSEEIILIAMQPTFILPTEDIILMAIQFTYIFRDCHGQPWGFPAEPAPVPGKTPTRSKGRGFQITGHGFLVMLL